MKFRKKPVEIEAVQWNPTDNGAQRGGWPRSKAWKPAKLWMVHLITLDLFIPTLEGEMRCMPGDWVIKGIQGEFYSCDKYIFEETYEPV